MIKILLLNLLKFNNRQKQPKLLSIAEINDYTKKMITILVDFIKINEMFDFIKINEMVDFIKINEKSKNQKRQIIHYPTIKTLKLIKANQIIFANYHWD